MTTLPLVSCHCQSVSVTVTVSVGHSGVSVTFELINTLPILSSFHLFLSVCRAVFNLGFFRVVWNHSTALFRNAGALIIIRIGTNTNY